LSTASVSKPVIVPTRVSSSEKVTAIARQGATIGLIGAAVWFAFGLESILRPQQWNARDTIWFVPFAFTALTFIYLHRVQQHLRSAIERYAFYALMLGSALVALGNVGLTFNQSPLSKLGFPAGAMLWMAGMLFYGIAVLREKTLPKYVGWALILFEPGSILTGVALSPIAPLHERGGYSAGVEKGLAVFFMAWGMRAYFRKHEK
jgi:hypothetical protein